MNFDSVTLKLENVDVPDAKTKQKFIGLDQHENVHQSDNDFKLGVIEKHEMKEELKSEIDDALNYSNYILPLKYSIFPKIIVDDSSMLYEIPSQYSDHHQTSALTRELAVQKCTIEKPVQCTECNYKAPNNYVLTAHKRTHSGEKPFQCFDCGYKSAFKHALVAHTRTHTDEKPFQCTECDFKSASKYGVKYHKRKHERPLQCSDCDYRAARKNQLVLHARSHTGEKPFQCNYCDYKSASKDALVLHTRRQTCKKRLKCSDCDCNFFRKRDLTLHVRSFHTYSLKTCDKTFQCPNC